MKGYNAVSNNCEQFVSYCIKGRKTSDQISNGGHAVVQIAARAGLLGNSVAKLASGPAATVTLVSTGLKAAGEYAGLPDEVNTIIGAPGDMVAKPIESAVVGVVDTVGNTYDKLSEGEIVDAAGELIGGTVKTAVNVVLTPLEVVGDVLDALGSWWDK